MRELASADVGVHSMWNEHFGIGVVEMMAAGLAVVAHSSGGPAMDIVCSGEDRGLLATTAEEYADAFSVLLVEKDAAERRARMAACAREFVSQRFSEDTFSKGFLSLLTPILDI